MRTNHWIRLNISLIAALALAGIVIGDNSQAADSPSSGAGGKKPNILILWGDDIGFWNVSAYNQGMMGYKTPNHFIDSVVKRAGRLSRGGP